MATNIKGIIVLSVWVVSLGGLFRAYKRRHKLNKSKNKSKPSTKKVITMSQIETPKTPDQSEVASTPIETIKEEKIDLSSRVKSTLNSGLNTGKEILSVGKDKVVEGAIIGKDKVIEGAIVGKDKVVEGATISWGWLKEKYSKIANKHE